MLAVQELGEGAGFHSILSAIRSLDSSAEVVSISYDSRSPHGNINNKSIPEGDKFAQIPGCFSLCDWLVLLMRWKGP